MVNIHKKVKVFQSTRFEQISMITTEMYEDTHAGLLKLKIVDVKEVTANNTSTNVFFFVKLIDKQILIFCLFSFLFSFSFSSSNTHGKPKRWHHLSTLIAHLSDRQARRIPIQITIRFHSGKATFHVSKNNNSVKQLVTCLLILLSTFLCENQK